MSGNPIKGRCGTCDWPTNTLPCVYCEAETDMRRRVATPETGDDWSLRYRGEGAGTAAAFDVYALKHTRDDDSEWIQEHESLESALSYQSHSGGVLVKRERLPGQPGLWWVEVQQTSHPT